MKSTSALLRLGLSLILAGIISAKRKPFVLHLNVLSVKLDVRKTVLNT